MLSILSNTSSQMSSLTFFLSIVTNFVSVKVSVSKTICLRIPVKENDVLYFFKIFDIFSTHCL